MSNFFFAAFLSYLCESKQLRLKMQFKINTLGSKKKCRISFGGGTIRVFETTTSLCEKYSKEKKLKLNELLATVLLEWCLCKTSHIPRQHSQDV